jgi:hypothetical protein
MLCRPAIAARIAQGKERNMPNGRWSLVAVWQKTSKELTNRFGVADRPWPAHAGLAGRRRAGSFGIKFRIMDDVARPVAVRGLVRGLVLLAAV